MISIPGANCIYFEPSDSGGVCNHPDMKYGFWIFSYREGCVLTRGKKAFKAECELRVPKITPVTKVIKTSKPQPKPRKKAPHVHKGHIHKREK